MSSVMLTLSYEVEVVYRQNHDDPEELIPETCIVHTPCTVEVAEWLKNHALDEFYRKQKEGTLDA